MIERQAEAKAEEQRKLLMHECLHAKPPDLGEIMRLRGFLRGLDHFTSRPDVAARKLEKEPNE